MNTGPLLEAGPWRQGYEMHTLFSQQSPQAAMIASRSPTSTVPLPSMS